MATEKLNINGISASDSGNFSGSVTDIDEAVASADGNVMSSSTNGEGETLRVTLTDSAITDANVVTALDMVLRCSAPGTGNNSFDVELFIGGVSQGSANTGQVTGSLANYNLSSAGWDADWTAAQLDGAEVLITCVQNGKGVNTQYNVDCLDVDIVYSIGPDEQLDHYRFVIDNNPGSSTGFNHESATDFPFASGSTEDTSFSATLDTTYALVCKVGNDGDTQAQNIHQLEYRMDSGGGYGAWTTCNATSLQAQITGGSDDDTASSTGTERLTATSRTFQGTRYEETAGNCSQSISAGDDYELYYSLRFLSANLTGGESVQFRINNTSDSAIVTNNVIPTATIPVAGATHSATMTGTGTSSTPTKQIGKDVVGSASPTGTIQFRPRVWLNTTQSKSGADEMTVTSYNYAGTSITFSDPSGGKTGNLFLGVENLSTGQIGWIPVVVTGGEVHTATMTGTGSVSLVKEVGKLLDGASTPTGSISTVTAFLKTIEGSLAATGALLKQAQVTLAGSSTWTGALNASRVVLQALDGSLTATGALLKRAQITLAGSSILTGTVNTATNFLKSVVGSLTATGALLKQTQLTFTGSSTWTGALASSRVVLQALAGSLTATGALLKQAQTTLTGSVTATGAMTYTVAYLKALAGSLAASGALLKQTRITLTGSSTWTGFLDAVFQGAGNFTQEVGGSLTAAGALTKQAQVTFAGTVSATGQVFKGMFATFTGSMAATGTMLEQVTFLQSVAGSVTATGQVFKQLQFLLTGTATATGALVKQAQVVLSGSVTAAGNTIRDIGYNVAGSLAATGAMTDQFIANQAAAGSSTWTGILNGVILTPPTISAAVNAFRGYLGTFLGRQNRR